MNTLLHELPTVFLFENQGRQFLTALHRRWIERNTAQFAHVLETCDSASLADRVQSRLKQRTEAEVEEILVAPQVHYMMFHRPPTLALLFVDQGLDAMEAAVGAPVSRNGGVWSIWGDAYYPAGWPGSGPTLERFRAGCAHAAPRAEDGLTLDFASPFTRGPLPEIPGDDVPLGDDEHGAVVAKAQRSVSGLWQAHPAAARFYRDHSKDLVLRTDSTPTPFISASNSLAIGRPVLRNAHREEVTVEVFADALVHEAMHCVIDLLELDHPMLLNESARSTPMRSGWTGRSLDLNTYLQACFVWFGLFNLWWGAQRGGAFSDSEADRLLVRARAGFADQGAVSQLVPVRRAIAHWAFEAVEYAQSVIDARSPALARRP